VWLFDRFSVLFVGAVEVIHCEEVGVLREEC
jgi:hypothetical protein